ncbi:hypothetical protein HGRIS_006484 [Hohenbuehelia grisea]|uniref:Uncharacterized protein n=1 Tax=Hohenbuehelia grisea TaxID=104357 RepID=A0ABR3K1W6_9AGAR
MAARGRLLLVVQSPATMKLSASVLAATLCAAQLVAGAVVRRDPGKIATVDFVKGANTAPFARVTFTQADVNSKVIVTGWLTEQARKSRLSIRVHPNCNSLKRRPLADLGHVEIDENGEALLAHMDPSFTLNGDKSILDRAAVLYDKYNRVLGCAQIHKAGH